MTIMVMKGRNRAILQALPGIPLGNGANNPLCSEPASKSGLVTLMTLRFGVVCYEGGS